MVDSFKEITCEVFGKVQKVGLRSYLKNEAESLDICGYVENNEDGSVSVLAQGDKEKLDIFIERIKKGSIFSRIDNVEIEWQYRPQDSFTNFEIR